MKSLSACFIPLFATAMIMACASQAAASSSRSAAIIVDTKTGKVLYNENPDALRYPASLTKMMTLYLTFEALQAGRLSLDSPVTMSRHAASMPPSKLGVPAGGTLTVKQAILSMVTRSANDVATGLCETIGGTDTNFARMMTSKAHQLGMSRTTYRNCNGLPSSDQMTTARDQARLGIALREHFPQYYDFFSTRNFRYGKQNIPNHNRLLGSVRGVDGIKTGFTNASGFNLVTSIKTDGRSVVGVVLGGRSGASRDAEMRKLLAKYVPQASRSGDGDLIAQTAPLAGKAIATDDLNLPKRGPVPLIRYDEPRFETAYADTPTPDNTPFQAVSAPTQDVAVPRPAPLYQPKVAEGDTADSTDDVTTGSTGKPSGWVIQVGAAPNKDLAVDLLAVTKEKAGRTLNSTTPFTMAYNDNGSQFYRVRFGGFGSQEDAVNACGALKKKGMDCWASLQ